MARRVVPGSPHRDSVVRSRRRRWLRRVLCALVRILLAGSGRSLRVGVIGGTIDCLGEEGLEVVDAEPGAAMIHGTVRRATFHKPSTLRSLQEVDTRPPRFPRDDSLHPTSGSLGHASPNSVIPALLGHDKHREKPGCLRSRSCIGSACLPGIGPAGRCCAFGGSTPGDCRMGL